MWRLVQSVCSLTLRTNVHPVPTNVRSAVSLQTCVPSVTKRLPTTSLTEQLKHASILAQQVLI